MKKFITKWAIFLPFLSKWKSELRIKKLNEGELPLLSNISSRGCVERLFHFLFDATGERNISFSLYFIEAQYKGFASASSLSTGNPPASYNNICRDMLEHLQSFLPGDSPP
jgi:hypothetical protein